MKDHFGRFFQKEKQTTTWVMSRIGLVISIVGCLGFVYVDIWLFSGELNRVESIAAAFSMIIFAILTLAGLVGIILTVLRKTNRN